MPVSPEVWGVQRVHTEVTGSSITAAMDGAGLHSVWEDFWEKVLSKQVGVNWVNREDQGPHTMLGKQLCEGSGRGTVALKRKAVPSDCWEPEEGGGSSGQERG